VFKPVIRPNSISSVLSASPKSKEISICALDVVEKLIKRNIKQSFKIAFIGLTLGFQVAALTAISKVRYFPGITLIESVLHNSGPSLQ